MRKMTRSKMATQPYKYIGKELDRTHGLDWYDHGARHYAPVTGDWSDSTIGGLDTSPTRSMYTDGFFPNKDN